MFSEPNANPRKKSTGNRMEICVVCGQKKKKINVMGICKKCQKKIDENGIKQD